MFGRWFSVVEFIIFEDLCFNLTRGVAVSRYFGLSTGSNFLRLGGFLLFLDFGLVRAFG